MAHPEQMQFMRLCRQHLIRPSDRKFIEIGSYDVNQAEGGLRALFGPAEEYVGVDLTEGPNVDLVASGHEVDFADETFDVALSCECFEHNPEWLPTFRNMYRMVKPGGVMIITVATAARLEHGTTRTNPKSSPGTSAINWNYYRNLDKKDFTENLDLDAMFDAHEFYYTWSSHDLYFWGIKRGGAEQRSINRAAIRDGLRGLWRRRKAVMSDIGFALRVLARIPLYGVYLVMPKRWYQDFAVPYERACYFVAVRLGIPLKRSAD